MEALLTAALVPFLPYLVDAGKRAGQEIAEALGTEAGGLAQGLWEKLRPSVDAHPAAGEAAADVAADPGSELAQKALEHQLAKLLAADSGLASDVGHLLDQAQAAGIIAREGSVVIVGGQHVGAGGVAAGRDIVGGVQTSAGVSDDPPRRDRGGP